MLIGAARRLVTICPDPINVVVGKWNLASAACRPMRADGRIARAAPEMNRARDLALPDSLIRGSIVSSLSLRVADLVCDVFQM